MMNRLMRERSLLGSPAYQANVGALAANAVNVLDLAPEASAQRKYAPFNAVVFANKSAQDIEVYLNQSDDSVIFVPANTIVSTDSTTAPAVRSLRVKNVGSGAISAGEVRITYQRTVVDAQDAFSSAARFLIGNRRTV